MDPLVEMLLWTALAGSCVPAGAALARIERIRPLWLEEEFRNFGGYELVFGLDLAVNAFKDPVRRASIFGGPGHCQAERRRTTGSGIRTTRGTIGSRLQTLQFERGRGRSQR